MNGSFLLFKFACKAALACTGMGPAGEVIGEVIPEMARYVHRWWAKDRPAAEVRADLEAIASVNDDEAQRLALRAVAEEAPGQSEDLQLALVSYLSQIPATVRQTQRRPADPTGRTVPGSLLLRGPADVMALLPPRSARFHKGQRAPGFVDWELSELLGIGGFGEVWKATNPHLPPVALKFCLDPTAARSLRNEADLLGRVVRHGKHPGIVALLNTSLCGEPPCLMYEYVPGGDLGGLVQQWLATPQTDRVGDSLAVMRQLAEVIAFAHKLTPPIVHRDLKPANLLLQTLPRHASEGDAGKLKVADFGIGGIVAAQAVGLLGTTRGCTLPTAIRGSCTPLYASPQQMRGEEPDPRDDIFALGVMWYQMLAGDLCERPGTDWREELADVPSNVLDVLGRCLAVRAERRFRDGGVLRNELAALGEVKAHRRNKVAVVVSMPDDEDEGDPDDLAGQLQRSITQAQRTLAQAVELSEQRHDYAAAVRLLEGLPEAFRDSAFLDDVRHRRDRTSALRLDIRRKVKAMQFAGVRDQVEELLDLQPDDIEAKNLLGIVPWQPGEEVVNSVGMKLVLLPTGTFKMGSPGGEAGRARDEGPTHPVALSRSFYLAVTPVTQAQYQSVTGTNPSHFRCVPGHDTRTFPVENVSWDDAVAFCRALSKLPDERRHGRVYRLPSEAEWEYACRAGQSGTPFVFGSALASGQANFDGRHPYGSGHRGDFLQRTTAVGSYPASPRGLYDLHGNVWEWCADWYADDYYRHAPRIDPRGPDTGQDRVLRGGSWQNHGRLCRTACRDRAGPRYRSLNAGFRVVLEVRSG